MGEYTAPLDDLRFVIHELAEIGNLRELPVFEQSADDLLDAVLDESSRFAREVISPTNGIGDTVGSRAQEGTVRVPPEFTAAYSKFVEAGWQGLEFPQEIGGMGLPGALGCAATELWHSANLAFGLCPMLTAGAISSIAAHGSQELKNMFLPSMVTGEWTGTMNLTEPQAGSDLSTVRTRAVPEGNRYRIHGTKIFITWGDHEMTENVVHLVLARLPDAPAGVKGISLFLVPKYLVNDDGSIGQRNDVSVSSTEHKLGIHGSPTCVMNFGEEDGAIGYLVGDENNGLACMFTMMNHARLHVGVQGLAISDRAYQDARAYALERVQGRTLDSVDGARIVQHPDVHRMLMTMKSLIEAMRVTAAITATYLDYSHFMKDEPERSKAASRVALLTPIVKGWMTEVAQELTSLGVQIHGGNGYIEETGVAQHLRDARILTIYEGTTGIQANDLVHRKVLGDGGKAMQELLAEIDRTTLALSKQGGKLAEIGAQIEGGRDLLAEATKWLLSNGKNRLEPVYSAAFNYLMLAGTVVGAWQIGRAAEMAHRLLESGDHSPVFCRTKISTARFYVQQVLPRAHSYCRSVMSCDESTMEVPDDQL